MIIIQFTYFENYQLLLNSNNLANSKIISGKDGYWLSQKDMDKYFRKSYLNKCNC